jgi:hypothetical protein
MEGMHLFGPPSTLTSISDTSYEKVSVVTVDSDIWNKIVKYSLSERVKSYKNITSWQSTEKEVKVTDSFSLWAKEKPFSFMEDHVWLTQSLEIDSPKGRISGNYTTGKIVFEPYLELVPDIAQLVQAIEPFPARVRKLSLAGIVVGNSKNVISANCYTVELEGGRKISCVPDISTAAYTNVLDNGTKVELIGDWLGEDNYLSFTHIKII